MDFVFETLTSSTSCWKKGDGSQWWLEPRVRKAFTDNPIESLELFSLHDAPLHPTTSN